jgi:acyl-CoA synthetase (AMP-forming)/AMP-acid ligase II
MEQRSHQIIAHVARWAASTPNRPAVTDRAGTATFGRLWADAGSCAAVLAGHRVQEGEVVGLLLPNRGLFVTALLGIARMGAIAVLFPTSLSAGELRRYGEIAGARLVLAGPSHEALILEAGGRPCPDGARGLRAFAFTVPPVRGLVPDDCLVQLTSGADQPSKLAVRTRRAVWQEIQDFAGEIGLTEHDTTLVLPSISHSYGLIGGTLAPLCRGGRVILQDGFDPRTVLQVVRHERPTILFAVPVMYRELVRAPGGEGEDLSSLRLCFSAGAPLPQDVDEAFARRFGRRICENYGSTEAGVIALRREWAPRLQHSVGRPVRGRTLTIVGPHGQALHPGDVGEVVVRSPALARGYLGEVPAGTAIDGDCFRTGDLGWVDGDGHLFLAGRKSSLIDVAGVTVDPVAVEAVIASMPGVQDVAVVGVAHPAGGGRAKAVVVAKGVTAEDVLHYCRPRLPDTHLPQVVEFRNAIPRTPAGKTLRRLLGETPQHLAAAE